MKFVVYMIDAKELQLNGFYINRGLKLSRVFTSLSLAYEPPYWPQDRKLKARTRICALLAL